MKSIRIYLVVSLLATITLINFISALHGYRASMQEAQNLFDRQLADTASLIVALSSTRTAPVEAISHTDQVAFQIWSADKTLLQRSANAPDTPIAPLLQPDRGTHNNQWDTHNETNFHGARWHTLTRFDPGIQRWVIVAERVDMRFVLAEKIILESVLPILFGLPVAGVLIWCIVGHGLATLRQLAHELRHKRADDLSPLCIPEAPAELTPVIESTNVLLQRLQASFERERRFAADAAHELRTPISALKVHLHNLTLELPADNPTLQQLRAGLNRLDHLVEQMLSLYRTTPDHYLTKFQTQDLYALTQEAVAQIYDAINAKQQSIELLGAPCTLDGDKFSLLLLLQNLLSNANKYTPEGGRIQVQVEKNGDQVVLAINDSGPGIAPQEHERVFERFYRVGGDRHTSGVLGCGLGLSIVKHIARMYGASIELGTSVFGRGLAVTIRFPAKVEKGLLPGGTHL